MQQSPSSPASPSQPQVGSFKSTVTLVVWLAEIISLPPELLLHYRVGLRFVRVRGPVAALVVVAFSLLFAGEDLRPLYGFLGLYLLRCVVHGLVWWYRISNKMPLPPETTYFPGYPFLWRLMPGRPHESARWLEVFLVFAAGVGVCAVNLPLGAYLMVAAIGLGFTLYLRFMAVMNRIWDMHDSTITQRMVAEGFREQSGG